MPLLRKMGSERVFRTRNCEIRVFSLREMGADMSGFADIYYLAWKRGSTKTDRRVNSYLVIPTSAFACEACSGSGSLFSLPEGRYVANNFRTRSDAAVSVLK